MENAETEHDYSNLTLTERLTSNFYGWEKRGRGWYLWADPVQLEPLYVPFYHEYCLPQEPIDDGRQPTFLSNLTERVIKCFRKPERSESDQEDEEDYPDSQALIYTDESPLREIMISLPLKQKIEYESAEKILFNLSSCLLPLSFEIVGTSESIFILFVCREPDYIQVKQQIQAYFPDAVLYNDGEVLPDLWDMEKETLIADFGLSSEFMRPLQTYTKFEPDPLIGIVGALENLIEGELGIYQILFQPARFPWSESIVRSVRDGQGKCFFFDCPDMVKLADQKVQKPLFAAVLRVIAQSDSESRAWEIVRGLSGDLAQFTHPQSNTLIPLKNDDYDDVIHVADVISRQSHRSGMILNSEELVSLVHPPSVSVRSKKIKREVVKTKAAPEAAVGNQLILGENHHQGQVIQVSLNSEQRLRHTHIIGATGTGKSTLLLSMIHQDIINGQGIAVLDPHGDLIDKVLENIPEERFDDVVLIDPSDTDYPIGLNILSAYSAMDKVLLSSDLVSVFKRLSTSWGDQMNSIFANAVLAFLESEEGGTLIDLRRFLVEKSYRQSFLTTVKDDKEVLYYWQKQFPLLTGRLHAPILTRLDTFLRPKPIRYMVAQKKGLNFQEILDGRKIFLAKLSQGMIGIENAYLLGTIIVSKFHQAAMARQAQEMGERKDFFLYIDEFHNFITESMTEILSGARKYNFGLILAHQELRQLVNRDQELANSVITNPNTRICFRMGNFDAKRLEDGFSYFEARDLQNLGVGEAIVRLERVENDFNLKTEPLDNVPSELAQQRQKRLIELSRQKYACPREELEDLLAKDKEVVEDQKPVTVAFSPSAEVKQKKPAVKKADLDEKELSSDEKVFLEYIHKHPAMFVTKIYKALTLSGYKGDKLKADLIERDLIVQEETRKGRGGRLAKTLNLTAKGAEATKKLTSKGKGGDLHREIQYMIKEQAEVFGWEAAIEERIPKTLENVDVGLKKDDMRVAVEISDTSKPEYEIQNIRKCLDAGYDYIVSVCTDDKSLSLLKTESKKCFSFKERERIRFYLPSGVKDFFSVVSPAIVSENGVVSGHITKKKQLLDTKQAAEFLGIKTSTLYEWISQRKIPHIKVGSRVKFREGDLEKWLEKRVQEEQSFDIIDE